MPKSYLNAMIQGVLWVVVFAACNRSQNQMPAKAPVAVQIDPIATVNGEKITQTQLQRMIDRAMQRFSRAGQPMSLELISGMRKGIAQKLIEETLIQQRARSEGIVIDEIQETKAFDDYKNRLGGEQAFAIYLQKSGLLQDDVRRSLRSSLLREKLLEKLVKKEPIFDVMLRGFYDENRNRYEEREQIRASHIFFGVTPDMPKETKDQKWKNATQVLALAKKKNADFAMLARQYGEGESKKGGDLGTFHRGRMLKAFEDAAFNARVGDIIGPIETENGLHIIKVVEKKAAQSKTFEQVKDDIRREMVLKQKSEASAQVLQDLHREATIEIHDKSIGPIAN